MACAFEHDQRAGSNKSVVYSHAHHRHGEVKPEAGLIMSNRCRSNVAPEMSRRDRILRVARAAPSLSVDQMAAFVGCTPIEVHGCLVEAGFATRTDVAQVLRMAEDPRCTPEQLEQFSLSLGSSTRRKTALHPNCSPRTLVRLANDPNPQVRKKRCSQPGLPDPGAWPPRQRQESLGSRSRRKLPTVPSILPGRNTENDERHGPYQPVIKQPNRNSPRRCGTRHL